MRRGLAALNKTRSLDKNVGGSVDHCVLPTGLSNCSHKKTPLERTGI